MDIENIQEFLASLQDYEKSFEFLDYDEEKYNGEIAILKKLQKTYNHQALLEFWQQKMQEKFFELKHPLYNEITTRAVGNYYEHDSNFVFFIDAQNKYPWILIQNFFLADFFVVKGAYYCIFSTYTKHYRLPATLTNTFKACRYQEREFGFLLGKRIQHYFVHVLNPYLALKNETKKVFDMPMDFIPKTAQNLRSKSLDHVYLLPTMAMGFTNNFQIIHQDALSNNTLKDKDKLEYEIKIWFGMPSTYYRTYIEKFFACLLVLKEISKYFKKIKVYVDGLTAYEGERLQDKTSNEFYHLLLELARENFKKYCDERENYILIDEKDLEYDSLQKLQNKEWLITFKNLAGYDYRTKIYYCEQVEIAISEGNSTAIVPFDICQKPGVCFIPFTPWSRKFECCKMVDERFMQACFDESYKINGLASYHLPGEYLYNLTAQSLEELSLEGKLKGYSIDNPLQMHRLPVPPVELYSKLYELEKKTQISLKGNKAELEILEKIQSQKKLLEMQNLLCESAQNSEIAPSTKEAPKPRGAKERVHHHLAYKLGEALIICSKSFWGYITMPYVLSYIKAQHRFEQEKYQRAIDKNPALKLPKLESYADYEDALKEQQCYTYKLGAALMEADKDWIKGGYLRFYFLEVPRLKRGFREKNSNLKKEIK